MRDQEVTLELPTEFDTPLEIYFKAIQAIPTGENEDAAPVGPRNGVKLDIKPATVRVPDYKKAANRSIDDLLGDPDDIIDPRKGMRNRAAQVEARRIDLIANGYNITPTEGKKPVLKGWQQRHSEELDARRWTFSNSKATNTGIILGNNLLAIDIDVTDKTVTDKLINLAMQLGDGAPLLRIGKAPKALILYRTDWRISKSTTAKYRRPDDDADQAVEILGAGQQFIADGIHPIGTPYTYVGNSPLDVAADELPLIDHDKLRAFMVEADRILSKAGWAKTRAKTGTDKPDLFRDLLGEISEKHDALPADRVREILADLPPDHCENRDLWFPAICAVHDNFGGSKEGFEIARQWSMQSPKYNAATYPRDWKSIRAKPNGVTMGTLIKAAAEHQRERSALSDDEILDLGNDADDESKTSAKSSKLSFLTPSDCAAMPSRGYVIKGFIAPGDVGCIFGEPGAGKSMIAPYLGYMVSQGKEAFGMRTKPGKVFYLPAEDESGMQMRVRALREQCGDADDFFVVRGANIADENALIELLREVKRQRPSLIVIDTLAASFPGLEENSSEAMSKVVRVGKRLVAFGAAVLFIHHSTKDANGTPRGHSVLNGALDVSMELMKADQNGIVHGHLKKNRNGSIESDIAFRIQVHVFGLDEDGDPISAGYCEPCKSGSAPKAVKLNPTEREALEILRDKLGQVRDMSQGVPITDWRKACLTSSKVSASSNPESVRKATQRAIVGLFRSGIVTQAGENVFIEENSHAFAEDEAVNLDDMDDPNDI